MARTIKTSPPRTTCILRVLSSLLINFVSVKPRFYEPTIAPVLPQLHIPTAVFYMLPHLVASPAAFVHRATHRLLCRPFLASTSNLLSPCFLASTRLDCCLHTNDTPLLTSSPVSVLPRPYARASTPLRTYCCLLRPSSPQLSFLRASSPERPNGCLPYIIHDLPKLSFVASMSYLLTQQRLPPCIIQTSIHDLPYRCFLASTSYLLFDFRASTPFRTNCFLRTSKPLLA
jgi:hypothetical protein